jgi:hypothetical protein
MTGDKKVTTERENVWTKVSHLETEMASIKSDVRGLYTGIEEIREVLVRMQENTRPNVQALVVGALAVCSFLVTIGGLTVAPIWRGIDDINSEITRVEGKVGTTETRLTERMYRDEELLLEEIRRQARIEGALGIFQD